MRIICKLYTINRQHHIYVRRGVGDVTDGIDSEVRQFPAGGSADIDHIAGRQRPDLLPEVIFRDHGDGVRLLHIAAQLGEYLVERYPDAHRQAQFLLDCG